jgi:propanediol utilization protein
MKTLKVPTAAINRNHIACPTCDAFQCRVEAAEYGSYECESCDRPYLIDESVIKVKEGVFEQAKNRLDNLEVRIKRLEKELGLK